MSKHTKSQRYESHLVGTMFYIAPEVFRRHYTFHCDMWSFGVVMFIMLFGYPPFNSQKDEETKRKILAGFSPVVKCNYGPWFPEAYPVSDNARDLIRRLLEMDPALRLTAGEVLEHPWIASPNQNAATPLMGMLTNLAAFTAKKKLKNVVLAALSSALDEKDADDLKAQFSRLDSNRDGVLSADELIAGLGSSTNDEVKSTIKGLLAVVDADGDGGLSYEELVMASLSRKLAAKEERMVNVFRLLDTDGDGKLTAAEIGNALNDYISSTERIEDIIREVDVDGDGCIDYAEFVAMFISKERA
jgi:calcium-dependent protein kinase